MMITSLVIVTASLVSSHMFFAQLLKTSMLPLFNPLGTFSVNGLFMNTIDNWAWSIFNKRLLFCLLVIYEIQFCLEN